MAPAKHSNNNPPKPIPTISKKSKPSMLKRTISFRRKSTSNISVFDDNDIDFSDHDEYIQDEKIIKLKEANKCAMNYQINEAKCKYHELFKLYPSWTPLHTSYELTPAIIFNPALVEMNCIQIYFE